MYGYTIMQDDITQKFVQACSEGNEAEFYAILSDCSDAEREKLIKFDRYTCFHKAAAGGHAVIVRKIFTYVIYGAEKKNADPKNEWFPTGEAVIPVFEERKGEGFKAALSNGHMDVVESILQEEYLNSECLHIILQNDEFIKIILNSKIRNEARVLLDMACYKNINEVKRLLKIVPQDFYESLLSYLNFSPFETVCRNGHIEILKLLWDLSNSKIKESLIVSEFAFPSFLITAADKGYVEIVRFIYEQFPIKDPPSLLSYRSCAAYVLATKNNHTDIVAYFEKNSSDVLIDKMKKALAPTIHIPFSTDISHQDP